MGIVFGFGCGGSGESGETTPFMPSAGDSTGAPATGGDDGPGDDAPDDGLDPSSSGGEVATSGTAESGGGSTTDPTLDTGTSDGTGASSPLDPPAGMSSGGAGGGAANGTEQMTPTGVLYRVIAPGGAGPLPAMVVYSGTEGGMTMTNNLLSLQGPTGNTGTVFVVLDGVQYNGDAMAGADALDDVRANYDIDNDRTYLLSESAGTSAGLVLGLQLRQSYFAAYWANDVNTQAMPTSSAEELGFAPWGNAGPGGDFPNANAIVAGMQAAGYRTEDPAPYDGPGSGTHGDSNQFIAALSWFPGRTRQ